MSAKPERSWVFRLRPSYRIIAAVAVGIAAFFLQPGRMWVSDETRIIVGWDVGVIVYLAFAWIVIAQADRQTTRSHTQSQDQSASYSCS